METQATMIKVAEENKHTNKNVETLYHWTRQRCKKINEKYEN